MNIFTNRGVFKKILPNSNIFLNIKKQKNNTSRGEIKDGGRDTYIKKCRAGIDSVLVMMSFRHQVSKWKRLIVKNRHCLF